MCIRDSLQPDIELQEDISDLKPLGNRQEPFLQAALNEISITDKFRPEPAKWNTEYQIHDPLKEKRQIFLDERINFPFYTKE